MRCDGYSHTEPSLTVDNLNFHLYLGVFLSCCELQGVRLAPILVPPAKVENVSFNHGEMEDANGVKAKGIHG
jgi:hypothetical protein